MNGLDYSIGTRVRLLRSFDGLTPDSEGVVIGFYRTDPPTYAVRVGKESIPIPPEYLIAVDAKTP